MQDAANPSPALCLQVHIYMSKAASIGDLLGTAVSSTCLQRM